MKIEDRAENPYLSKVLFLVEVETFQETSQANHFQGQPLQITLMLSKTNGGDFPRSQSQVAQGTASGTRGREWPCREYNQMKIGQHYTILQW